MNVSNCLDFGVRVLKNRLEAEILLAHILGKSREFLTAHSDIRLANEEISRFKIFLEKRERGIPIAYLTRHKDFFGLDFYVDERVLIPRPETELLVELALDDCQRLGLQKAVIADIGTGSGNIVISLAKNLPNAKFIASDISKSALEVAKQNVKLHGVTDRITFIQSDLLENIHKPMDIIVTNLPYVGTEKFSFVEENVKKYEPPEAVFGGNDGLSIIKRLFSQILKVKQKPRIIIGEFGFLQREILESILNKFFVQNAKSEPRKISFYPDLAGIDRAFIIHLS